MRENCRKRLSVLLALVLLVSLCACGAPAAAEPSSPESGSPSSETEIPSGQPEAEPEPKPEPEPEPGVARDFKPGIPRQDLSVQEVIDRVIDSYYVGSGEVDGPYKGSIPTPGPVIGAPIYWYTTDTGDRESMEALLEHLQTGAGLVPRLKKENWVYSIVYDDNGYICGHVETSLESEVIVAADTFSAEEAELYRRDFRWPELLEAAITEGKFEYPDKLRMRACDFVGFAIGAVLYDGGPEYFVPTNGEALHSVPFEVGKLYPMDELADLLYDHLDELFGYPPVNTGAKG